MNNRDSLLPRSLFSASTLKKEPVEETIYSPTTTQHTRRNSQQSHSTPSPPVKNKKRIRIQESDVEYEEEQEGVRNNNSHKSGSSSNSSSSEEEEDDMIPLTHNTTAVELNHVMNTLMIKLERQQARQSRYLDKVKILNKAVKKTNRMIVHHANLLVKSNQILLSNSAALREPLQLAKRSAPFDSSPNKHCRISIDDQDGEEEEEVQGRSNNRADHITHNNKPTTVPKSATPARPLFPIYRVNRTPKRNLEIDFGTRDKMDIYTMRRKKQEYMATKKPRSLLYNIADNNMDRGMSELMITTSLDGELQFWNTAERRKIKTIGQNHLYDSWIDDICWATPSTLAFCPPQKLNEPVKLVHIGNVSKNNVEGRIQTLTDEPHENGIAVIASMDTGTYSSRNSETCSFVTGGYDKSVYLWSLKRESPVDNFTSNGVHRLNIKHTSAVWALCYDKYKNTLISGGSDERLIMYDVQSSSAIRELRFARGISQVQQSKVNPNIVLVTTTNRADQFCVYDQRVPGYDGIKLRFGQHEQDNLSRFIRPDMHENGYMVCCGGQGSSKLNFWDLRYTGVSRSTSFGMDTQAVTRSLRSMFLPNQDAIVSLSSSRLITWLDYGVQKDEVVKSLG